MVIPLGIPWNIPEKFFEISIVPVIFPMVPEYSSDFSDIIPIN
jgi:hypothetical protein